MFVVAEGFFLVSQARLRDSSRTGYSESIVMALAPVRYSECKLVRLSREKPLRAETTAPETFAGVTIAVRSHAREFAVVPVSTRVCRDGNQFGARYSFERLLHLLLQ